MTQGRPTSNGKGVAGKVASFGVTGRQPRAKAAAVTPREASRGQTKYSNSTAR
ncbi:hypothetical protein OG394_38395 [Kribbella sp. NBC_01245]|uniref:hypothetical protein n=1 Tax=Kribbella sp. NBC_01245 TaxID=2903578 RepID=UPI002E27BA3F|nr:hypothetical protein [Kribbella sp. NBC_01245]